MVVCEPGWLLQEHGLPTYAVSDGSIVSLQLPGTTSLVADIQLSPTGIGVFQAYYQETYLREYSPSTISWIASLELAILFGGVSPSPKDPSFVQHIRKLTATGLHRGSHLRQIWTALVDSLRHLHACLWIDDGISFNQVLSDHPISGYL